MYDIPPYIKLQQNKQKTVRSIKIANNQNEKQVRKQSQNERK